MTTTYPATDTGLRAALAALGGTVDAVAAALRAGGHRGRRVCAGACPVANYLASLYPTLRVLVGFDTASIGTAIQDGDTIVAEEALRQPVLEFVRAFDEGSQFIDLVEVAGGAR